MHPIHNHALVEHRMRSLAEEAYAERLAAHQRLAHGGEHAVHPSLDHPHVPGGLRAALGRALIGLGSAIAGRAA